MQITTVTLTPLGNFESTTNFKHIFWIVVGMQSNQKKKKGALHMMHRENNKKASTLCPGLNHEYSCSEARLMTTTAQCHLIINPMITICLGFCVQTTHDAHKVFFL